MIPAGRDDRMTAAAVAAGAVVAAGVAVAVLPQHAVSIGRVLVAALVVVALVEAVQVAVDRLDRHEALPGTSPFERTTVRHPFTLDRPATLTRVHGEVGAHSVRADLAPLSGPAARRLHAIATTVLDREGLDLSDGPQGAVARGRLSPAAVAALTADRNLRPVRGRPTLPGRSASAAEIAATVHAVLDELERPPRPGEP